MSGGKFQNQCQQTLDVSRMHGVVLDSQCQKTMRVDQIAIGNTVFPNLYQESECRMLGDMVYKKSLETIKVGNM